MENINRSALKGYVGSVRMNEISGKKVVNFTLATDVTYKGKDNVATTETTWHNVVAWSSKEMPDLGLISKGTPVHLIGRLRSNKYTNAEGVDKYYMEVLASKVKIVTEE